MQVVFKEEPQNIYTIREITQSKAKQRMKASVMQKVFGGILLIIGVITPVVIQDATISVLTVPLGLYLMLTREVVL